MHTEVCTDVLSVHTHVRRVRTRVGTVRMHVRDARALCIRTVNTHVRTHTTRTCLHTLKVLCSLCNDKGDSNTKKNSMKGGRGTVLYPNFQKEGHSTLNLL